MIFWRSKGIARAWLWIVFAAGPALAQDAGVVTLVEGQVRLLRGVSVYVPAEGVRLQQGDIVETMPKSQAQIELADGTILNLDASSKLYLGAYRANQGRLVGNAELVLLQGWLKYFRKENTAGTGFRLTTPTLSVAAQQASGILRVAEGKNEVFLESGAAKAAELSSNGKLGEPIELKVDEYLATQPGKPLVRQARAPKEFVGALPRQFVETLPSRRERLKNRIIEAKKERDVTYDEIGPWLKSNPRIRQGFVKRFTPRVSDPVFRKALEANLRDHREWHRVLYPEMYKKDPRRETVRPR